MSVYHELSEMCGNTEPSSLSRWSEACSGSVCCPGQLESSTQQETAVSETLAL